MANVAHLSEAVTIALHTMVTLARHPEGPVNARDIAERLRVSEHHLQKVHQRLNRAGLVQSVRGPAGGVTLALPPDAISFLAIFEAIEGPLIPRSCAFDVPVCGEDRCILSGLLLTLDTQARDYLKSTTLDQFVTPAETPDS